MHACGSNARVNEPCMNTVQSHHTTKQCFQQAALALATNALLLQPRPPVRIPLNSASTLGQQARWASNCTASRALPGCS
jgi:hypothetical protein